MVAHGENRRLWKEQCRFHLQVTSLDKDDVNCANGCLRVCLNKMECLVTEGAGIHCLVDLGQLNEDVVMIL